MYLQAASTANKALHLKKKKQIHLNKHVKVLTLVSSLLSSQMIVFSPKSVPMIGKMAAPPPIAPTR